MGGDGAGAQAAGTQRRADAGQEQDAGAAQVTDAISDEELDVYILTRLKSMGVDLSVLPEDDEDAPADQRRILRSARRFLRGTPPDIHGFEMDPQLVAPVMYPSETIHRTRRDEP